MQIWNKRLLVTAVLFSAQAGQVYAADVVTPAAEDVTMHSAGETVVTATRTEKRDVDVPAATVTITADDIERSGAVTASDVLAKVNGFAYTSFGPNGAAMGSMTNELNMRGLKGGVLVLMNGNPIAWRGKYNLDQIPAGSIERVEVVKGSGSVLYGSDAVSGVVNIITKKTLPNEVHAGFGNYGQRSYGISVGDEHFGFYYNADKWGRRDGVTDTDYAVPNFHGTARTDISDIIKRNAGLTYHISPRMDFQFGCYETEGTYARTVTFVDTGHSNPYGLHAGTPINRRKYETKQYITQLNYHDRAWKANLFFNTGTLDYAGVVQFRDNPFIHTPNAPYHTREKNTMYGLDVQRTWKPHAKASAVVGMDLAHEIYAALPTNASAFSARYARSNWALFGQWEQRFDARNTGIFGLRETWTTGAARNQNYHNLSASAQWLHKIGARSSAYLNITQSFVMPTFSQMYADNGRQHAAPDLHPQKGVNYEIGWKKKQGTHSWKTAIFYMRVRDNISARLLPSNRYQYTNEEFRNVGLEVSDDIHGTHGLSYRWGVTLQDPQINNSKKHLGWERSLGRIQLTGGISYQRGKWTSDLSASYLAGRVQLPSAKPAYRTKPYLLTTWNTSYAPDERSEISLRIDNVLDRFDSTSHAGAEYHTAPINYLLSCRYRF